LIPSLERPLFFYLDAHWEKYWPLLDELQVIADNGVQPIIVIHDFFVPGSNLGFDKYDGQRLDFEYIEPSLQKIYGNNFTYEYNRYATGARRGIIYVFPVKG